MAGTVRVKKVDEAEESLRILREIASVGRNKLCFDCGQRGPTYVNMTVGSFVCTSCSGLLRGLNPPHRIKSITMASFTPEEMDFIKCHGNDFCGKVWNARNDPPDPHVDRETSDDNKLLYEMSQKYEKKRWYSAPTDELYDEARKQNMSSKSAGHSSAQNNQMSTSRSNPNIYTQSTIQRPTPGGSTRPVNQLSSPTSPNQPFSPTFKYSGQSIPANTFTSDAQRQHSVESGFANFANFRNQTCAVAQAGFTNTDFSPQCSSNPTSYSATPSTLGFQAASPSLQGNQAVPQHYTPPVPSDKYAALAELDTHVTAYPGAVNWDGTTFGDNNVRQTAPSGELNGEQYVSSVYHQYAHAPISYVPVAYSQYSGVVVAGGDGGSMPVHNGAFATSNAWAMVQPYGSQQPHQMSSFVQPQTAANPFANAPMVRRDSSTNPFL